MAEGTQRNTAPLLLEQRVEVETPEQVVFAYTIAGVGSRTAAALIDYVITIMLLIAISYLSVLFSATFTFFGRMTGDWATAVTVIMAFAVVFLYFVLFEGLNDGQSPGKQALGLRVVQDGGYSVSFAASAVRNIVRLVDMLPGIYAVGLLAVILSKTGKRLGDHAAGTIVVQERAVSVPFAESEPVQEEQAPVSAVLTDEEYGLLERYLARRPSLTGERRAAFDLQMVLRLADRLPADGQDVGARLQALYRQEKTLRARGVASRSDTGAAREQHAIVAAGSNRWREFATALAGARRGGLKKMSEEEVADFVSRYREISTDLARLRTASRQRDSDAAFYLSRLIGAGHNLLYKQRQLIPLLIWNFLVVAVPREVRRSIAPILLATFLLFGPATVAHVIVARDRAAAELLVPPTIIERAENAARRGSYLSEQSAAGGGPVMASGLVTNNVRVSFGAFALGITAGLGTIYILMFNGLILGGALGVFASHDVLHLILAFVLPHGVIELMAICIAGGGGLLLGSAFVLPGNMTRREALVVRGRRAIRLVTACAILLIFAAIIEGFISPRNLPVVWAATIGVGTGLLAIMYFALGGRSRDADLPEEEFAYSEARPLSSR
jgi:uncharacterized membrane protein SpoIIM required for sporulation